MFTAPISRILKNQRIFILLFLVLGIAWLLHVRDSARTGNVTVLEHQRMVVDPGCDVTTAFCSAILDGASLRMRIGPGVSALKPFPLEVTLAGLDRKQIRSVTVEYSMKGMDMGPNHSKLQPDEGAGWKGSSILPICTSGRSDWVVEVRVVLEKRLLSAQFPFTLKGPAAQ